MAGSYDVIVIGGGHNGLVNAYLVLPDTGPADFAK
jgi:tRNA U34 5-carboxymethylaminomethyl modifying enzyme MnmG/GidA